MTSIKKSVKLGRLIYFVLASLFTLCVIVQFYFAALAIFVHPDAWAKHMTFVHISGFNVPIFMLVFAIIGRLPRLAYWQLFGVFFSIFLMYFTVNVQFAIPFIRPMHVMIAIFLLILSCSILITSMKYAFRNVSRKAEVN